MKLFDRFDKVYCINLEHREDRKNHILSECNKYDLGEVSFFNAFNGNNLSNPYKISNGNFGLILTNIEIIKEAKNNNYKNILILEDDCYFTSEVLNINTYFDALPDDWDMLYFGGTEEHDFGGQIVGAYAYCLNRKLIEEIYYMLPNSGMEVDNFYAKVLFHMSYNYNKSGKYDIKKIEPFNTVKVDFGFTSNIR